MEMHAKASLSSRSTATTTGAGVLQSGVVRRLALSLCPLPQSWVWSVWYLRIYVSGSCVLRPATCEMRVDSIYPICSPWSRVWGYLDFGFCYHTSDILHPSLLHDVPRTCQLSYPLHFLSPTCIIAISITTTHLI